MKHPTNLQIHEIYVHLCMNVCMYLCKMYNERQLQRQESLYNKYRNLLTSVDRTCKNEMK